MPTFADDEAALAYLGSIPWGNAAGVLRTHDDAIRYASTGQTITTYGSIIAESGWTGNPGTNFWYDEESGISINAIGLGDPGIDHHLKTLRNTCFRVEEHGSQLWVSFSARAKFDPREYRTAASRIFGASAAHVLEGNFSCGNVVLASGQRKPLVCWDQPRFEEGVAALREGAGTNPIAVKIAPITEAAMLENQVATCIKYGVDYLVMANCIPGGFLGHPDGSPVISMVRGGIGGTPLPSIVSGMIMIVRPMIEKTSLKIIAVGGVGAGKDRGHVAYQYLKLGAHGFAFNTAASRPDGGSKIAQEIIFGIEGSPGLLELLVSHGLPD